MRGSRPVSSLRHLALGCIAAGALASPCAVQAATDDPVRPSIMFNRWQEDWSVLANPDVPHEMGDSLKYVSLSPSDPATYLSLGAGLRERFEFNDAAAFGTDSPKADAYLLSRLEGSADLHLGRAVQVFVQLESDGAVDKRQASPVDRDDLDLEQAFVVVTRPLGQGLVRLRLGRQQFGFDLQRFVSVRDGPNVRQSFDAAWAELEHGSWRIIGFYSQPVQARDKRPFDDTSSGRLTYSGLRAQRRTPGLGDVSIYISRFTHDAVDTLRGVRNERRDIVDAHIAGAGHGFDWDIEGMAQGGRIGAEDIRAWAFGSLGGYTFAALPWSPRLGLQFDGASGDRNPRDKRLETFNPLFPNGYYLTLAGYTGYVNFLHLKPSLTLQPRGDLKLLVAGAIQWRATTADAVFTQPDAPVPDTAGRPGRYSGAYGQIRADWRASRHLTLAAEAVHFAVGDVIRRAGGHDATFLAIETRYGW